MRKATLIGTIIAAILVFGLMLVPIAGANTTAAPPLQATSEPTTAATEAATEAPTTAATEAATEAATTAPAATAAATEAATTTAATATTAPGALPRTGGDSGMGAILLGIAALFIIGVAVAMLVSSRRRVQP
ncbi:MAG TPA: LPXTG cell wall anchor domain-containing protein [Roseiflexaceae bacterium]|jgi:LPXTG-motif cell wall-anchored protein